MRTGLPSLPSGALLVALPILALLPILSGLPISVTRSDEYQPPAKHTAGTPAEQPPRAPETPAAPGQSGQPGLRYPVDLELLDDDRLLAVINERSGTLSVLDVQSRQVLSEQVVGRRLADLVVAGNRLIVADHQAHEVILLRWDGSQVTVQQRVPVSPYPVKLALTADQQTLFVSSLWSRQLSRVRLGGDKQAPARVVEVRDLPFAPRELLLLRDDRLLLVADAFGGRLAITDAGTLDIRRIRSFPAHNIRGLATSHNGQMLIVTHQMLNSLAHTVRNDVHWGLLMSNDLRWLKLENVLGEEEDLYRGAHMHPLGEAGSAAGDPAGVDVAADGTVSVALAGVGQVAIGSEDDFSLVRVPVGRRPVAVRSSADSRRAYVADMFGDSISVIDLPAREVLAEIRLGPQRPLTEVERGEQLFFDARLSHDGWMSCHSCHTDGHTNGLLNDNFSDQSFGAPKRVMSLLGRDRTEPFAWNATAEDLESQVANSIQRTMQADQPPKPEQVAALAAFVRSLPPPPPIDQLRGRQDQAQVARGRAVFERLQCAACHAPPVYTTPDTYDVGLADDKGNRKFNPPSLRGVGQRGPYFHDNRAKTLRDVFERHQHRLSDPLPTAELDDLLAFLRSL